MTVPIDLPAPVDAPPGDLPSGPGWKTPIMGDLWGILFGSDVPPGYKDWHNHLVHEIVHDAAGPNVQRSGNHAISSAASIMHLEDLSAKLLWNVASYTMADLYDVGWHLRWRIVPKLSYEIGYWRDYLWQHLQHSVAQLERTDAANLQYLWTHLVDSVHALERTDAANLQYLWTHLVDSVHALERTDAANLAAARAYALTLHRTVEADLARDVTQLERYTDTKARQAEQLAVATIDQQVTRATAATWPVIIHEADGLRSELGRDFAGVRQLLAAVPGQLPVTAAAAVAFAASMVPALTRLATDCTVPMCRDLGPLRDLMHILASAAFDAALLAWLIEMITQPAAAARITVDVADPIITGTMTALAGLLRIT